MTILPQLERDLSRAAEARLPASGAPARPPGRPRRAARLVPVLLAVAVALAVTGVALTLHHGRRAPAAAAPSGVAATRHELVGMLGILRRPQTKADLDRELLPGGLVFTLVPGQLARRHELVPAGLKRRIAQLGFPKIDRALVRVVRLPAWRAKVGIEPVTWRPSPASPQRAEGLDLELWIGSRPTIPPSSEDGTGPQTTSVATIGAHGLALADPAPGGRRLDGVVLLPDGVARITLRPVRLLRSPVKVALGRFGAASATVHDNIAAFRLAIPTVARARGVTGMFGTSVVADVTWYGASGTVTRRTTTEIPVLIAVRRAP